MSLKKSAYAIVPLICFIAVGCERERGCVSQCGAVQQELETARLENYSLGKQLDILKAKVAEQGKICDLAASIEKSTEAARVAAERTAREQEHAASKKTADWEHLRASAKSETLSLDQWKKLLDRRSKSELLDLLGPPPTLKRPSTSAESINEVWSYPGKVKMVERAGERWNLVLQVYHDKVIAVEARK